MTNVNEIVPRGPRAPAGWQFNRITPEGRYDEGVEMHNIDSVWIECRKALESGCPFVVTPLKEGGAVL